MTAPDPRNVRDMLLEAGYSPIEVERMLTAGELVEALLLAEHMLREGSFANGNVSPDGIDEGDVLSARALDRVRRTLRAVGEVLK